ncbi:3'-5' exonuclease [Halarcobacter ebronensis]|uniref:DNA polymerase III subunit epsilon n=1 Tax=Halarcobacter ebronensis TaxID=1462615 RepID=A0A4Q1AK46_9BACT|nr:3'-5' exonuclease [Halarcobacter ebronensis]QKF82186.1 DEDDh 3'-5' exonuclease domain family protein [Halarcobacter ebronensis]RXK03436.1 DNA polymerase III subunit epsilon [Halarcobacter ebronensis]
MIIIDFETNTMNPQDVIEAAAVKLELVNNEFKVVDKFHRYYLSRYPVNPYSYEVHRLTPEKILAHRNGASYSSYFSEDLEFIEFCRGVKTLIAHNINFELRHLEGLVRFEKHFCTMKENKNIVKAINRNGSIKNPKLDETCLFYGIDFDPLSYHSATYDVSKTYEILKKMNKSF